MFSKEEKSITKKIFILLMFMHILLSICTLHRMLQCDQSNEDEMVEMCSMHGNDEKCIQTFNRKT